MSDRSILPGWEGGRFASGRSPYFDGLGRFPTEAARIYLDVWPGSFPNPVLAMVDTAAPWCLFDAEIGEVLRETFERVSGPLTLSTRLGRFTGSLYTGTIGLETEEGRRFDFSATAFVSPDWSGGNFLGYEGFLQWLRFAVDPGRNHFYFGPLE